MLLVATPVCAAVVAMIAVLSIDVLLSGAPYSTGDAVGAVVFSNGCAAVVFMGLAITFKHRDAWAHRIIGSLLVAGTVLGTVGGLYGGWSIMMDQHEELSWQMHRACETAQRDGLTIADCPERARECIYEVRENPPEGQRGLAPPPTDPGRPVDLRGGAIDDCLRR